MVYTLSACELSNCYTASVDNNQNPQPILPPNPVLPTQVVTPVPATAVQASPTPLAQPAATNSTIKLDGVASGITGLLVKRWWAVVLVVIAAAASSYIYPYAGIIILVLALAILKSTYEASLFHAFAVANDYTFTKHGPLLAEDGIVFAIGHNPTFTDVVMGYYRDWPFSLYVYSYTIGYGRDAHTYHRATMDLKFETPLPAFLLKRHTLLHLPGSEGESLRYGGYTEPLNLEGDFNKHFRVYIQPNTQIDVLSILTPDVMQLLVGLDQYEIELTPAGNLYIHAKGYLTKKEELLEIYSIIEALTPKVGAYAIRQQQLATLETTDSPTTPPVVTVA